MWQHMRRMGGPGGWILGLAICVLAIVLIIVLIKNATGSGEDRGERTGDSPLDILEERYARGEIDEEEFERRKRKLQQ